MSCVKCHAWSAMLASFPIPEPPNSPPVLKFKGEALVSCPACGFDLISTGLFGMGIKKCHNSMCGKTENPDPFARQRAKVISLIERCDCKTQRVNR